MFDEPIPSICPELGVEEVFFAICAAWGNAAKRDFASRLIRLIRTMPAQYVWRLVSLVVADITRRIPKRKRRGFDLLQVGGSTLQM